MEANIIIVTYLSPHKNTNGPYQLSYLTIISKDVTNFRGSKLTKFTQCWCHFDDDAGLAQFGYIFKCIAGKQFLFCWTKILNCEKVKSVKEANEGIIISIQSVMNSIVWARMTAIPSSPSTPGRRIIA